MQATREEVEAVIKVVVGALGIEEQALTMEARTPLFGDLPELDSLGVVELAVALENRFDIQLDDEDITGEVFETIGSLADFVASKQVTDRS